MEIEEARCVLLSTQLYSVSNVSSKIFFKILDGCNLETPKLLNFSALDGSCIRETLVADTALGVSSDLRR